MRTVTRRTGFTLIELLVVISIIAVLMGILMPALGRIRKQARAVACQANLKQLGVVINMYADEHNGSMVPGWLQGDATNEQKSYWINAYRPYYGNEPKVLLCPMAKKPTSVDGMDTNLTPPFRAWGVFGAGEFSWLQEGDTGSYGINDWTNNPPKGTDPLGMPRENFWRTINVKGVAEIPLMADCDWMGGFPQYTDKVPTYREEKGGNENNMLRFAMDRHNGGSNVLFLDFTVRKVPLKSYWHLKWHKNWDLSKIPGEAVWTRDADWANMYPYINAPY